jgi:hypothetical protein
MNRLDLLGVGFMAPGLDDWAVAGAVLRGETPYLPAPLPAPSPVALPPNERRRATLGTRLALAVTEEATRGRGLDPAALPAVFTASESDLGIIDRLCTDIFGRHTPVSPTVFHNSVHNAVAGYWSIAQGCRAASTSLSAWDGSLAAGLLEAAVQLAETARPLLLIAYDLPGPPLLAAHRPLAGPCACALLLAPTAAHPPGTTQPLATLTLDLDLAAAGAVESLPDALGVDLEALRAGNPAARVLPLLRRIAAGTAGTVCLPYLTDLDLVVGVELDAQR